jgi:hypothetical protein
MGRGLIVQRAARAPRVQLPAQAASRRGRRRGWSLSAILAKLHSVGVPKDSVIQYETAVKAEGFLVLPHSTPEEVARAKAILGMIHPADLDVHPGVIRAR